jgi:predicted alpha/beta hydrolase family esterase
MNSCKKFALNLSAVSLTSLSFVGCGTEQESSLSRSSNRSGKIPLIIAIGGRESCVKDGSSEESPFYSSFYDELKHRYGKRVSPRKRADFMVACHNADLTMSYYTSWNHELKKNISELSLYRKISKVYRAKRRRASATILLGHSFGGWVAMKYLSFSQKKFDIFYTIDPISKKMCGFRNPSACQISPPYITIGERRTIKKLVQRWINFFQTETIWLHASKIVESTLNIKLKFGHTEIDNSKRVWQELRYDLWKSAKKRR